MSRKPLNRGSFLRIGITLLYKAAWAPLLVAAVHTLLAAWFGHFRELDPFFHFAAGFSGAFCLDQAIPLLSGWLGTMRVITQKALVFSGTATAALFWEFAEFAGDLTKGTRVQLSVSETMMDLILGVVGALLYLVLERLWSRRRPA